MVIAIDFDGTLCKHRFPEIGPANDQLIDYLIELHSMGHILILWTCRENMKTAKYLDEAVSWCKSKGLNFHAVNQNVEDLGGFASRKILADIYVDDRMLNYNFDRVANDLRAFIEND